MKKLIIACGIFALIISVCLAEYFIIDSSTKALEEEIDRMQSIVLEGRIDDALDLEQDLNDKWHEKHVLIAAFTSHDLLDDVDKEFRIMQICLENEDVDDFLVESASAKSSLSQLKDGIVCNIHNIL